MDLEGWLAEHGLVHLLPLFRTHALDLDVVRSLNDDDILSLGLTLGDRKRLQKAIAALSQGGPLAIAPSRGLEALDAWPSPLGDPVRAYYEETNPSMRLWLTADWAEMLLRFFVFVRLGELKTRGPLPSSIAREISSNIGEPTLGRWKRMATVLAEKSSDSLLPEFEAYLERELLPVLEGPVPLPEQSLQQLRNRLAHGGGMTRAAAARLDELWRPAMERLWRQANWLSSAELLGLGPDGTWRVLARKSLRRCLATSDDARGAVLKREERSVPLWPFYLYCPPTDTRGPHVQQAYLRRGDVTLQYTVLDGSDQVQTDGDEAAYRALRDLLRSNERSNATAFQVRGFEDEMRRDSDRLIGREGETQRLMTLLADRRSGILWLSGHAGSGKSMLAARVATELWARASEHASEVVLSYRFRAGDDRCSRAEFVFALLERLAVCARCLTAAAGLTSRDLSQRIAALRSSLSSNKDRRLTVIVDGLDELEAVEPGSSRELVTIAASGGRWLCTGRPVHALLAAFAQSALCTWAYPDGLPPMSEQDVRAMLMERLGPVRRRVLEGDTDEDGTSRNAFITKVTAAAFGLPIYVTYVIADILQGRLKALDAGVELPATLDDYHGQLLKRGGLGIVTSLVTQVAAVLAVAREPLSVDTVVQLLQASRLLPQDPEAPEIVRRVLASLEVLVQRGVTPDGEHGFVLFHHSLRQHILKNPEMRLPVMLVREGLASAAAGPIDGRSAPPYILRQGVAHLLEAGRPEEAVRSLTDVSRLARRIERLGRDDAEARSAVRTITRDFALLRRSHRSAAADTSLAEFERFWLRWAALLERTAAAWPVPRTLVSAALQEPTDGAVHSTAAGIGSNQGPRFASSAASFRVSRRACVRTLEAHSRAVRTIALSTDASCLVSGSENPDGSTSLLAWSPDDVDVGPRLLPGNCGEVISTALNAGGSLLLAVGRRSQGNVLLVDVSAQTVLCSIEVDGASCCAWDAVRGAVLIGTSKGSTRVFEVSGSSLVEADRLRMPGAVAAIATARDCWAVCGDGFLLVFRWEGGILAEVPGFRAPVSSVTLTSTGRLVAAGDQAGRVIVWDVTEEKAIHEWHVGPDQAGAIVFSADETQLFVGLREGPHNFDVLDRTIRVFDLLSGACTKRLVGQWDRVLSLAYDEKRKTLYSGGADFTLRAWDVEAPADELEQPVDTIAMNSVRVVAGGQRVLTASDDRTVRVWDATTLRADSVFEGHQNVVWAAVPHPFADLHFSASEDGTLRACNRRGALLAMYEVPGDRFFDVALSPDGRWLGASVGEADHGSGDPRILIWDLSIGGAPRVLRGPRERVPSLSFSPSGNLVAAASWDGKAYLWDVRSEKSVWSSSSKCCEGLVGVAFSPDGSHVVVSHVSGGAATVLDVAGSLPERSLRGHTDQVRRMVFTPSGDYLITGSDDETIRLWRFDGLSCCDLWPAGAWVTDLAVTGGTVLFAGMMDGRLIRIHLVDLCEGAAPVRPVVPWVPSSSSRVLSGAGHWGETVFVCPWCGAPNVAPNDIGGCPSCRRPWNVATHA